MRKLLSLLGLAVLLLTAVLLVNTWRLPPTPAPVAHPLAELTLDQAAMARRLGTAIGFRTLSPTADSLELEEFLAFHTQLSLDFPRLHAALDRQTINQASLLYHWRGSDPACAPTLLISHQDVVPVEPGTDGLWQQPPFSGAISEGYIWGRGAIDDKSMLMATLEAIEQLLAEGHQPRCSVYLGFGHDEEVGGIDGANAIAAHLLEQGIKPAMVIDEGGAMTVGVVPGVSVPVATIGVAEKGYLSVRLQARSEGGHSSMPTRRTAIGRLASAVAKLEEHHPAAELGPVQTELLTRLAPQMPFAKRIVMSNLWLTAPLVTGIFANAPATDATQRTTTAPTMFQAGVKDNVLPQNAEAVVNFRIRPGDSIAGVLQHVRLVIDDESIDAAPDMGFASEPTEPAPWTGNSFARIERAIRAVAPPGPIVVAPYVTTGGTDARHYAALTPNLYRVGVALMQPEDLSRFHGNNERIAIEEYVRTVRFYMALLRGLDDG